MRELLDAIGFLGIRQAANLVLSIVRAKILAILLGPAGIGIVSQASNFQTLLWNFSNGVGRGVTVLTADSNTRKDFIKINRILVTSLIFLACFGGAIMIGCAIFAGPIAMWIFSNPNYQNFVMIIAASAWFAFQLSLVMAVFRGLLKIRAYTFSFVLGYFFTILGLVILVYAYGLVGAILSILAGQIINFFITAIILKFYVFSQFPEIGWLRAKPNWETLRQILNFFGPILIIQVIAGMANLLLRGELIRRLSEEANGFYQVVWGMSLAYMTLVNDTVRSYVMPKIASHLDRLEDTINVQNNMLRVYLLVLSPFLMILLTLREIWIPILYSDVFLVAGSLMLWQFAGDLLTTVRININAALIPRKRFNYLIFEETISWSVWIGLSLWLMPRFGLVSIPGGYFVSAIVVLIISLTYQYAVMQFRLKPENLKLIGKLLPLLAAGFASAQFIPWLWLRIIIVGIIIGGMVLWLPTPAERKNAIVWARETLSRIQQTSHP